MVTTYIAELARKEKLTSAQLGGILGLSPQSANAKLNGVVNWTVTDLRNLSRHFHVSTDFLLGLSDNPSPKEVMRA